MNESLEHTFTKRLKFFFLRRDVYVSEKKDRLFIEFLYHRFKAEGRFNTPSGVFHLTPSFVINATADYLQLPVVHVEGLLREMRYTRATTMSKRYEHLDNFLLAAIQDKRHLIERIGRHHKPTYKVTKPTGSPVTPKTKSRVSRRTQPHFNVGFSPLKAMTTQGKPRTQATIAGDVYERDMCSAKLALWRKRTPQKLKDGFSPDRVQVRKPMSELACRTSPHSLFAKKVDVFEFSVTAEDIYRRMGVRRPVSQKRVMDNTSAFDAMIALGAEIEHKSGRNYHWAHRHGWSLNGAQAKENFDPTTAGSNFDTLFKVEAPIKGLLLDRSDIDEVFVRGHVEFPPREKIPSKIVYQISWNDSASIEVVIDPRKERVPTVDEHKMARVFFDISI